MDMHNGRARAREREKEVQKKRLLIRQLIVTYARTSSPLRTMRARPGQ